MEVFFTIYGVFMQNIQKFQNVKMLKLLISHLECDAIGICKVNKIFQYYSKLKKTKKCQILFDIIFIMYIRAQTKKQSNLLCF